MLVLTIRTARPAVLDRRTPSEEASPVTSPFTLAVCAEMVFLDLPLAGAGPPDPRARLPGRDLGLDAQGHRRARPRRGATFSSMTGYVRGELDRPGGRRRAARDRRGVDPGRRAARHPAPQPPRHGPRRRRPAVGREQVTGEMWLAAARTLGASPTWASARTSSSASRTSTPRSTTPARRSRGPRTRWPSSRRWTARTCG